MKSLEKEKVGKITIEFAKKHPFIYNKEQTLFHKNDTHMPKKGDIVITRKIGRETL